MRTISQQSSTGCGAGSTSSRQDDGNNQVPPDAELSQVRWGFFQKVVVFVAAVVAGGAGIIESGVGGGVLTH